MRSLRVAIASPRSTVAPAARSPVTRRSTANASTTVLAQSELWGTGVISEPVATALCSGPPAAVERPFGEDGAVGGLGGGLGVQADPRMPVSPTKSAAVSRCCDPVEAVMSTAGSVAGALDFLGASTTTSAAVTAGGGVLSRSADAAGSTSGTIVLAAIFKLNEF